MEGGLQILSSLWEIVLNGSDNAAVVKLLISSLGDKSSKENCFYRSLFDQTFCVLENFFVRFCDYQP